jgi:hypothetical protein
MMNNPEVKEFIRKHSNLFWYIPEDKKEDISHEVLVEFILNYGDLNSIRNLLDLLGIEKTAKVFFDSINLSPDFDSRFYQKHISY